jgi:hypothetical protein
VTLAATKTRVRQLRPFDADRLCEPTMLELARQERAAIKLGDFRRALAYRIVRVRRLARAQNGRSV